MHSRVIVALAFALLAASPAAASVARNGFDEQEVNGMRAATPHAVELLERGEALGAAGALAAAEALFRQTEAEAPDSTLARRRRCEALTALGRRDEAIVECTRALQDQRTSTNVRALVRSLVDGPTAPSVNQLFQALALTAFESHGSPGGVVPTAMACDIAESVGDGVMLKHCAEQLESVVPNDPETRRALATLQSQCPPWRFWSGWLAIAAAVAVTVGHALWGFALRRRPQAAALAAAIFLGVMPTMARAEEPVRGWLSKIPIDDEHPDQSMPSAKERDGDPLEFGYWLQDIALKAELATKRGDHPAAARFYAALAQAVPDRAVSFVKLCDEYDAIGDREKAIAACGDALLRDGVTVWDYSRFVHLVIGKPGALTTKESAALANVIQHLREDPASRQVVDDLQCEVGVRTSNVAELRECTAALAARAPEDPKTTTYQWALAIQEGHFEQAAKLIDRARLLGVQPASLENMKQTTAAGEKRHWLRQILVILGIGLLLSSGGAAAREFSRRRKGPRSGPSLDSPGEKDAVPG